MHSQGGVAQRGCSRLLLALQVARVLLFTLIPTGHPLALT